MRRNVSTCGQDNTFESWGMTVSELGIDSISGITGNVL